MYAAIEERSTMTSPPQQRKLSEKEVRSILESLYDHPEDTDSSQRRVTRPYTIVPCGPNCENLSPPSLEFPHGLYVLLRPQKKKKKANPTIASSNEDTTRVEPAEVSFPHAAHLISPPPPPSNHHHSPLFHPPRRECKWRLSGPQFPPPTAIQQRYCYPSSSGNSSYSEHTGAALYTLYHSDDDTTKERLDYRLWHVYYSSKRAAQQQRRSLPTTTTTTVQDDDDDKDHSPGRPVLRGAKEEAHVPTKEEEDSYISSAATEEEEEDTRHSSTATIPTSPRRVQIGVTLDDGAAEIASPPPSPARSEWSRPPLSPSPSRRLGTAHFPISSWPSVSPLVPTGAHANDTLDALDAGSDDDDDDWRGRRVVPWDVCWDDAVWKQV